MCVAHALYGAPQASIFKRPRRDEHDTSDIASTVADTLVQHAIDARAAVSVLSRALWRRLRATICRCTGPSRSACRRSLTLYLGAQGAGKPAARSGTCAARGAAMSPFSTANGAAVVLIWCFHYRVLIRGYGHLIFSARHGRRTFSRSA
jgi:hypothetical protein